MQIFHTRLSLHDFLLTVHSIDSFMYRLLRWLVGTLQCTVGEYTSTTGTYGNRCDCKYCGLIQGAFLVHIYNRLEPLSSQNPSTKFSHCPPSPSASFLSFLSHFLLKVYAPSTKGRHPCAFCRGDWYAQGNRARDAAKQTPVHTPECRRMVGTSVHSRPLLCLPFERLPVFRQKAVV